MVATFQKLIGEVEWDQTCCADFYEVATKHGNWPMAGVLMDTSGQFANYCYPARRQLSEPPNASTRAFPTSRWYQDALGFIVDAFDCSSY